MRCELERGYTEAVADIKGLETTALIAELGAL
jgi:hypothetical protein